MSDFLEEEAPEAFDPDGTSDYEAKLASLSVKKRNFIKLLQHSFGKIKVACAAMKPHPIHRQTYVYWMRTDPVFREIVESTEYEEEILDLAENALHQKIREGDTIALIFFLKTKGKKRGYIEKEGENKPLDQKKKPGWFASPAGLPEHLDQWEPAEVVSITTGQKQIENKKEP